jgi:hypothetical protein
LPEGKVSTTREQVSGQSWEHAVTIGMGTSASEGYGKTYQKRNQMAIARLRPYGLKAQRAAARPSRTGMDIASPGAYVTR